MKAIVSVLLAVVVVVGCLIGYNVMHETIPAGEVGYVYDRDATAKDNVIPGTSVLNNPRTGRITINPITQEVFTFPTTIVSRNWTSPDEGDNRGEDWSLTCATSDSKLVDADVYISVIPRDVSKLIQLYGVRDFDDILDNEIYAKVRGTLNSATQNHSSYDVQTVTGDIRDDVWDNLYQTMFDVYGIELVEFEIGKIVPDEEIQAKIAQKADAVNAVELAKLERERQDEVNQQIVDAQKAQSEKELLQRQTEADASAYEKKTAAAAELAAAEAQVEIAKQELEVAKLEKEAELEKQKSYTDEYFRDKELSVQESAVKAINSSLQTIITSGEGEGYSAIVGLDKVLDNLN